MLLDNGLIKVLYGPHGLEESLAALYGSQGLYKAPHWPYKAPQETYEVLEGFIRPPRAL